MSGALARLGSALTPEQFSIVCLDAAFNNRGITTSDARADGHFNIWGNSFPEEDIPPLGSRFSHCAVPFVFGRTDGHDNAVCTGQSIAVAPQRIAGLAVIAASERRSRGEFELHLGGETQLVASIGVSDWWPGARSHFGNRLFRRGGCLHYPRHIQKDMWPALWWARRWFAPVLVDEIRLPDNPAIHLFAMTCEIEP